MRTKTTDFIIKGRDKFISSCQSSNIEFDFSKIKDITETLDKYFRFISYRVQFTELFDLEDVSQFFGYSIEHIKDFKQTENNTITFRLVL